MASAARGYKEINLRAMKMVREGGYLVTCSCSQHILPAHFLEIVRDAARDATCSCVRWNTAPRAGIIPSSPRRRKPSISSAAFPVASLIRQAEHHQAIRIFLLEVGNGRFHGFPYRQVVHVLLHHVPDEACGFGFLAQRLVARLTRLSLFQLSRQARFFCLCLVELGFAIRQFRREGILLLLELVKLCFQGLRSACVCLCCGELLAMASRAAVFSASADSAAVAAA